MSLQSPARSSGFPIGVAELVSAAQLIAADVRGQASYELSVRRLPDRRSYLLATGLQQALETLEGFCVADRLPGDAWRPIVEGLVGAEAVAALEELRFEGDVEAIPEGTVVFEGEPVLRVRAPAPQAILVGSSIVSAMLHPTMVATEVSRMVSAAAGKPVYEFGVVSSCGREAAMLDARAAFIGGTAGSSCAEAVGAHSIPPIALVSLDLLLRLGDFDTVRSSLQAGARRMTVVLDTGKVGQGVRELLALGIPVDALLIDAGDHEQNAREARRLLDDAGWADTRILVTGGLSASAIQTLSSSDAPIDGFGVGRHIARGSEEVGLALDYDLVEWEQGGKMAPVARTTPGRLVEPFAKMVYRRRENGMYVGDVVQRAFDPPPTVGVPLLVPMMEEGQRLVPSPSIGEIRALAASQLQLLDPRLLEVGGASHYPVEWQVRSNEPMDGSDLEFLDEEGASGEEDSSRLRANALLNSLDDSSDFGSMSDALEQMVSAQLHEHPEAAESGVELPTRANPKPSPEANQPSPKASPAPSPEPLVELPDAEELEEIEVAAPAVEAAPAFEEEARSAPPGPATPKPASSSPLVEAARSRPPLAKPAPVISVDPSPAEAEGREEAVASLDDRDPVETEVPELEIEAISESAPPAASPEAPEVVVAVPEPRPAEPVGAPVEPAPAPAPRGMIVEQEPVTARPAAARAFAEKQEASAPRAEKPAAVEPDALAPQAEKPAAVDPVDSLPVVELPVASLPAVEPEAAEAPAAPKAVSDVPAAETPTAERPAAEAQTALEAVSELPVAEEPATDELAPERAGPRKADTEKAGPEKPAVAEEAAGGNDVLAAAAALKRARAGGSSRPAAPAMTSTPAAEPASSSEPAAFSGSEERSTSADPLLAAAARLKSLSGGGGGASAGGPAPTASAPAAEAPAKPAQSPSGSESTSSSANPLEAAAARLRALNGGGDSSPSPAPATPAATAQAASASSEPDSIEEIAPVTQDGASLLGAADRLKALRQQS